MKQRCQHFLIVSCTHAATSSSPCQMPAFASPSHKIDQQTSAFVTWRPSYCSIIAPDLNHYYHAQRYHSRNSIFGARVKHILKAKNTQPWDQLADDDQVALPLDSYLDAVSSQVKKSETTDLKDYSSANLRLCVIRNGECVYPLVQHEDDVETDLFLDPRYAEGEGVRLGDLLEWMRQQNEQCELECGNQDATMKLDRDIPYYGVGWYGQRPVPSLGGGPGYGADATEIWSIEEDVLETLVEEGDVEIPVIDVGMAHGEKARGGALF
mmetsp:Transcript_10609/g.22062  ORF Transcript_10609/g.22062 Transcript_10609/m.22062 type:complete len:267 (+) Transcript_10609:63-863(+)